MPNKKEQSGAGRLDDTQTALFKRQVEWVKTKTYDVKYKNLRAKKFIPVNTSVSSGARTIVWYSFSNAGVAKIIADYATDFPRVDTFAEENESKVKSLGAAYGYSLQEIREAQIAGVGLQTRKAKIARDAIEFLIDNLAWFGDTDYGIQGFINYPGITEYVVPAGASTFKTWATKTPDEINADLSGIKSAVSVPTKGKEEINQILIPRAQYELIKNTRMTDGDSSTVFTFFTKNNPSIAIDVLDELAGVGDSGTDQFIGYVRNPDNLTMEIPLPFEQMDSDKQGMEYVIPVHARFGGVVIYYTASVAYGDGI